MKKEKRPLPIWQVVLALAAALALVGLVFARGGTGEASKDEIAAMRRTQGSQPLVLPRSSGMGTNMAR